MDKDSEETRWPVGRPRVLVTGYLVHRRGFRKFLRHQPATIPNLAVDCRSISWDHAIGKIVLHGHRGEVESLICSEGSEPSGSCRVRVGCKVEVSEARL